MFYQTQTARRPPKGSKMLFFLSLVTLTFDLQTQPSDGTTHLPCEFGANPFSGFQDFSYTNGKNTDWQHQKPNLLQFSAYGNDCRWKPVSVFGRSKARHFKWCTKTDWILQNDDKPPSNGKWSEPRNPIKLSDHSVFSTGEASILTNCLWRVLPNGWQITSKQAWHGPCDVFINFETTFLLCNAWQWRRHCNLCNKYQLTENKLPQKEGENRVMYPLYKFWDRLHIIIISNITQKKYKKSM